jgi:hypothetical protein
MNIPPALELIGKIVVTIIALIVAWQLLKFVLKSAYRLFQIGCMVLIGILGIAWLVGWFG